jgi:hypothetical protein
LRRGELGLGVYLKRGMVNEVGGSVLVLPYVYGDYGRFFARVDTFGLKTLPLGSGHLELVARVNTKGFDAARTALRGVGDRRNPVPIGVGTMQHTQIRLRTARLDDRHGGAGRHHADLGRLGAAVTVAPPLVRQRDHREPDRQRARARQRPRGPHPRVQARPTAALSPAAR